MSPSAVDLHDISTLLNYERASAEPRFRHAKLREQCAPDGSFKTVLIPREIWGPNRDNVSKRGFIFDTAKPPVSRKEERDLPSNILPASPSSDSESVRSLSPKELEQIYWEVRGHDGCYTAITLFQHFFDLLPPEQKLRVRTAGGGDFETAASSRVILEFTMFHPYQVSFSTVLPKNQTYITGSEPSALHAVLGFPHAGSESVDVVVDLASMQFGSKGRGSGGETYRLESLDKWMDFTSSVCTDMQEYKTSARINAHPWGDAWLKECAERAKARWEARDTDHWCDYCGAPGAEKCCPCHDVWYCSQDHQKIAWRFHKHFCATKK